ncbi:hypothetical protein EOD41_02365 [Mucilaginibacter limnophilus]|uniref:DUF975 family protein n=1 Tax=Mucilaginibacter limnophilus TaxID=1932778 RepID=A0A3S2UNI3_9SPHI|nr:hypothetical protein [Mucilaginibacter limnophilus]RVU02803.1 hypothetical protein EOD41_02365 [Mucilaginibacter limnophilus]
MYHPFSIIETLKTSWHIFKNNFVTIIVYSAVAFILLTILTVAIAFTFTSDADTDDFTTTMIISFIIIFIQAYSTLGLYKLIFTVIDSEYYEFEFSQIVPKIKMVLSYLAVVFMLAFVVTNFNIAINYLDEYPVVQDITSLVGLIGGLYLAFRIMFFNTFIVDDDSGPFESLKQSFILTKGYLLKIISILGIILLLIALPVTLSKIYPIISVAMLFTYPFVNIVLAVTYRKLVYSHMDVDDDVAETD